ncbi:MAG: hypothetical protein J6Y43_05730, partial [Clostridia bacterium]|nr:hypothetical protein [Clostridia bacterium]
KLSESGKNKLKNIENYLNFLKKIKAINDEATANKKKTTDYIKIIESRLDDKEYTIYNGEELDYETKIKELEEKIEKFNEINKT